MTKRYSSLFIWLAAILTLLVFIMSQFFVVHASVESQAETVVEVTSGRVLYAKNEQKSVPMASTTKILTAIIIIEDCDLNNIVTIPEKAVGVEGSSIYLVANEKISIKDLLYGLMLQSGNDCAVALALYHSGTVEAFAEEMNLRARSIGALNSNFMNPHGLPDNKHFTTAFDLAIIAAYALHNSVFSEIVSTNTHTIEDGGCGYVRVLHNKNKMLSQYDGANGVKTGYTQAAGRCLVTSATRNGMQLVSVVLNSPDMYERSKEILDQCFAEYSFCRIFDPVSYQIVLPTEIRTKNCRCSCDEAFLYPIKADEATNLYIKECVPEFVSLPIHEGDAVGELQIYLKNQLLFSQKIVSIETVEKNFWDILREITQRNGFKICGSINIWRNAG